MKYTQVYNYNYINELFHCIFAYLVFYETPIVCSKSKPL